MKRTTIFLSFAFAAEEDFHSGDGMDKVGVHDVGQQSEWLDEIRVPVVRSDTFKGLLRDACTKLRNNIHYQAEWVARFPGVSLDEIYSEMFDYGMGESLFVTSLRPCAEQKPKHGYFRFHTQTSVNSKTGRAQDHTLRTIECGSAGLLLRGQIRGRLQESIAKQARAFLQDGLRNLRSIGGHRRRGLGRVKLVDQPHNSSWSKPMELKYASDTSGGGVSLLLTLEAVEPLHITAGTQVANLLPTLHFIPGSALLGALRHEWRVPGFNL